MCSQVLKTVFLSNYDAIFLVPYTVSLFLQFENKIYQHFQNHLRKKIFFQFSYTKIGNWQTFKNEIKSWCMKTFLHIKKNENLQLPEIILINNQFHKRLHFPKFLNLKLQSLTGTLVVPWPHDLLTPDPVV